MTTAWPEPQTAPVRDLASAPGCPNCDTWRWPLIGPERTIQVADTPFAKGVAMLWNTADWRTGHTDVVPTMNVTTALVAAGFDPAGVLAPVAARTVRVRECTACGHAWNEQV